MKKDIMKRLILSCLSLFLLNGYAEDQYPEERQYTSTDKGYTQYGAPSLHKSGQYALTFDDGPHPTRTALILDHLKAANARATFFIITSNVNESNIHIIKRMLDEGHLIGSHGSAHDNSNLISKDEWKSKVKKSFLDLKLIYQKAGHELKDLYYRFPYAAYGERKDHHHMNSLKEISQELTGGNCIQFAFWDFDSSDWVPGMTALEVEKNFIASNEGGKYITYKTIKNSRGQRTQIKKVVDISSPLSGGVILQHDIQASSVEGTKLILDYVKKQNLKIVRLDEVSEFAPNQDCRLKP